jgi:hypothetical protein
MALIFDARKSIKRRHAMALNATHFIIFTFFKLISVGFYVSELMITIQLLLVAAIVYAEVIRLLVMASIRFDRAWGFMKKIFVSVFFALTKI